MAATFLLAAAVSARILANPVANVFQKNLTARGIHPLLINFFTYFILAIACLFIMLNLPAQRLPAAFWMYAGAAGAVGALGNGFLVKALKEGDLSVLGPINSYKSVVGIIVGIFLLGEVPNGWGVLGIIIIIWGSYFVLDTTEDRFTWALLKRSAIQYRIWAMVLTAIEAVLVKKVIGLTSVAISIIAWCCTGALFSFILLFVYRLQVRRELKQIKPVSLLLFFYLVVCIGVMQATTSYAFGHMPVGYVLALFQLSSIVSVLLGHRLFNETAIRKKLIGSLIMIAGSVLIILLK